MFIIMETFLGYFRFRSFLLVVILLVCFLLVCLWLVWCDYYCVLLIKIGLNIIVSVGYYFRNVCSTK